MSQKKTTRGRVKVPVLQKTTKSETLRGGIGPTSMVGHHGNAWLAKRWQSQQLEQREKRSKVLWLKTFISRSAGFPSFSPYTFCAILCHI